MLSELLANAVETKPDLRLKGLILSFQMGQKNYSAGNSQFWAAAPTPP